MSGRRNGDQGGRQPRGGGRRAGGGGGGGQGQGQGYGIMRGRGGRGRGDQDQGGRGNDGVVFHGFGPPRAQGQGHGQGGGQGGGAPRGGGGGRGGPVRVFMPDQTPQIDKEVHGLENKYDMDVKQSLGLDKLSLDRQFPLRPAYGTKGEDVVLRTNYFRLNVKEDLGLNRYQVDVQPLDGKAPGLKVKKRIIQLLLEQHFHDPHGRIATDYKATLLCRESLDVDKATLDVKYRFEDETQFGDQGKVYKVQVQHTGTIAVSALLDYLSSTAAGTSLPAKEEIVQALNIVVGHHPKSQPDLLTVGPNRHFLLDPAEKQSLGLGLEALRGYFVSVRPATARLLANVQVQYATCFKPGRLDEVIQKDFMEGGRRPDVHHLNHFVKRLRVRTTHLERRNGALRINTLCGLATPFVGKEGKNPPQVKHHGAGPRDVRFFRSDDGRYVSVYDHFREFYNIAPKAEYPVVYYGTRSEPKYLPVEVCEILPGQQSRTKLSEKQTSAMSAFAIRAPADNAQSIVTKGMEVIQASPPNRMLANMGLEISPDMVAVAGRLLPAPAVKYSATVKQPHGASWNLQHVKSMTRAATMPTYAILHLHTGRINSAVADRLGDLRGKLGEQGGITLPNSARSTEFRLSVNDNRAPPINGQIDEAFSKALDFSPKPRLLLVILPFISTEIYNQIKCIGDIRLGVHTVCMVEDKLLKGDGLAYIGNVVPKINLRLGGVNQTIGQPGLGMIDEGKTMVVGIDVTHPSPGSSDQAPSVAGMVASVDQQLAQFPAILRLQGERRKEMVDCLQEMLRSRLRLWMKRNKNQLPENVLIYRDGVSEGQYKRVLEEELPPLRKACAEVYPSQDTKKGLPKISIIVVGKRHQTRFYPIKKKDADKQSNPKSGTVVDRGITEARNWDFFLQAHTALKGTARPAHYFVIIDEIFRQKGTDVTTAANNLEELTHKMCYLWGRATKAVSICPPAYYADLVCERARRYLSKYYIESSPAESVVSGQTANQPTSADIEVHEFLRDSMFYV